MDLTHLLPQRALGKSGEVWGAPGSGEVRGVWRALDKSGRSRELRPGPGRSGEVRGDLEGSGEVQGARAGFPRTSGAGLHNHEIRSPKT